MILRGKVFTSNVELVTLQSHYMPDMEISPVEALKQYNGILKLQALNKQETSTRFTRRFPLGPFC